MFIMPIAVLPDSERCFVRKLNAISNVSNAGGNEGVSVSANVTMSCEQDRSFLEGWVWYEKILSRDVQKRLAMLDAFG
jgi:hypothetical protein